MTLDARRIRSGETDLITIRACYGPVTFEVDEPRGHALHFWHELGKLVAVEDNEERAQAGYERYVAASDGRSFFSGDTLISWDNLPGPVRQSWVAAFTE